MSNPVRKLLGTWAALWCYTHRDQTSLVNNTQGVSAVLKVHMCAGSFTGHVSREWDHERCVRVCCDKCRHLPASLHTKTPWGRKRKTQSLATKRQSKLLTGSHGNRGETDKGLPRKAAFRLQRKTLRFNLTRLSLAVSPVITGRWCRGMNNDLWEESLKVIFHGTSMATGTYVCVCVSVIEKETKNRNEEAIFRVCLKWQEEENSDNAFLPSARGHVDKLLFPRQMESGQKVTLIERNSSVCAQKTEYLFWLH